MSKGIFQNPKKAAMFVGGTMLVVLILIGSEDQEGALVQAASSVEAGTDSSRSEGDFPSEPRNFGRRAEPDTPSEPVTWAEDEELIDDASGFDPTPEQFDPSEGDVYVIEDDD